ncbi:MAG: penicillin-binding protein 2 [Rhodospirillales bacterium]|jgi:cell division protein FtsI (penicillin-binding protein 3)|nr:penicillin-binding protein 2 [Rhodospirillales bacterium]
MTHLPEKMHGATGNGGATRFQLEGVRKQAIEMGRSRLLVAGALIMMAFAAISVRLIELMVVGGVDEARMKNERMSIQAPVSRASIVDRNGVLVAASLPTASLYADPVVIEEPEEAARLLASVLPGLDQQAVFKKITSKKRFVWLKRNLSPDEHYRINALGIPGFSFKKEERRVYPQGPLLAHVVGLTDTDGKGTAGLERYFDGVLEDSVKSLRLSLDVRVQSLVREELLGAMTEFSAIGAAAIVLDVDTGELLSMVSLPDFDPNVPGTASDDAIFNRATKGVYEMGSTFKLFTAAMALDAGTVQLDGGYDASEPITVARHTISDYHGKNRWLSVPEILIHSSNIGAAKMALDVGTERQKSYLQDLGLLSSAEIELPEIGKPLLPSRWREINTMTISFGHGIAVSPLQLASGVATLVNGGLRHPATILQRNFDETVPSTRVIDESTSSSMRGLMRLVVKYGTGKNAEAEGYMIGGKTGTADKLIDGRYSHNKRMASFVGAFPIKQPRYVVLVIVDEPVGIERTFNYATGGWVAAPIVSRIVSRMGPLLGMLPETLVASNNNEKPNPDGFMKTWERTFEAR